MKKEKAPVVAVLTVLFLCGFFLLSGCFSELPGGSYSQTRLLLDTFCTITIYTPGGMSDTEAAALIDEAFALCEELEALFSITIEGSDVWRINHAGGEAVEVSPKTPEVIERGIEFAQLSDGMFDITIGRLSRLWDFGSTDVNQVVPAADEIDKARQTVDYRQVKLVTGSAGSGSTGRSIVDDNPGSNPTSTSGGSFVKLQNSDAWLDFGGIAKGYIADEIAAFLSQRGITSALIDLGGDIAAVGRKLDNNPWRLGVRKPFGEIEEYIGILEVSDAAVVSSGVYERQFEENGVHYHHIIDPYTGYPAKSDVISATVIAADAVTGEGLSTIAVLTGSEHIGSIFAQAPGFIGAVIVLENYDIITFGDAELMN